MSTQNITLCVPRPSSGLDPNQPVLAVTSKPENIPENHVLIRVDRFGFSANNITYQALGEAPNFRYFEFHNAPETDSVSPNKYGLIPVWGFGTVITSTSAIQVGERVYGYFAPTRYLLVAVDPEGINTYSFLVPRPHLPADRRLYNQINRCAGDPLYNPAPIREDLTMLYCPLFWTSFWCEDWLFHGFDVRYRGAKRFLISSASAKTAFALAYCIKRRIAKVRREEGLTDVKVVGLTSKKNLTFTKGLGLYDVVLDYDSFAESGEVNVASGEEKWLYADVAGNDDLNKRILQHFVTGGREKLIAAVQLGLTTLAPSATSKAESVSLMTLPKPTSSEEAFPSIEKACKMVLETFFTVEWLTHRRAHSLTVAQIAEMQAEAWGALMHDCKDWVKLERVYGAESVKSNYERVGKRGLGPELGLIWSLWDEDQERKSESGKAKL